MVRAGFGDHHVARHFPEQNLAHLLDGGLVIPIDGRDIPLLDERFEELGDEGGGPVETAVLVHCGDDRLEGVCQKRGFHPAAGTLFPFAEQKVFPDSEPPGQLRQRLFVDDGGPQFRELPFGMVGEFSHQQVADGQLQDGVAQKLQPFVVPAGEGGIFVDERPVRQRVVQKGDIREIPAEPVLQPRQCLNPFLIHDALSILSRCLMNS